MVSFVQIALFTVSAVPAGGSAVLVTAGGSTGSLKTGVAVVTAWADVTLGMATFIAGLVTADVTTGVTDDVTTGVTADVTTGVTTDVTTGVTADVTVGITGVGKK